MAKLLIQVKYFLAKNKHIRESLRKTGGANVDCSIIYNLTSITDICRWQRGRGGAGRGRREGTSGKGAGDRRGMRAER